MDSRDLAASSARLLGAGGAAAVRSVTGVAEKVLGKGSPRRVTHVATVYRPPDAVYGFWRSFENLPRFLSHLERVEILGGRRSHWVARGPGGSTVEWDASITEDEPGRRLAWRSEPGAAVENEGEVSFAPAPGDRGTEVRVRLVYRPPGGAAGAAVAWLAGEAPDEQVREDLRRFKAVVETGEVLEGAAQPSGRGPLAQRLTEAASRRVRGEGRG